MVHDATSPGWESPVDQRVRVHMEIVKDGTYTITVTHHNVTLLSYTRIWAQAEAQSIYAMLVRGQVRAK